MAICSAVGCSNRTDRGTSPNISFHRFPVDPVRRRAWLIALRRKDWAPSRFSVLCAKHFQGHCFAKIGKNILLSSNAIPTIFPSHTVSWKTIMAKVSQQIVKHSEDGTTKSDGCMLTTEESEDSNDDPIMIANGPAENSDDCTVNNDKFTDIDENFTEIQSSSDDSSVSSTEVGVFNNAYLATDTTATNNVNADIITNVTVVKNNNFASNTNKTVDMTRKPPINTLEDDPHDNSVHGVENVVRSYLTMESEESSDGTDSLDLAFMSNLCADKSVGENKAMKVLKRKLEVATELYHSSKKELKSAQQRYRRSQRKITKLENQITYLRNKYIHEIIND